MDVLRCKTVDGVLKELHAFALVYNLARVVLGAASRRQGQPIGRLSFVDAVRWLRSAKPGERLAKLVVNPDRPDRGDGSGLLERQLHLNIPDPTGLQVLKCRVSGQRPSCHPSPYQGRGCENGRSTEDPASSS
jgi:hypothetical protein